MDINNIKIEDLKEKILSFADKKTLIKFGIGFGAIIIFLIIYFVILSPMVEKRQATHKDQVLKTLPLYASEKVLKVNFFKSLITSLNYLIWGDV